MHFKRHWTGWILFLQRTCKFNSTKYMLSIQGISWLIYDWFIFLPITKPCSRKVGYFWVLVFWFSYNERCLFQRNLPWDFKESVKKFKTQSKLLNHTWESDKRFNLKLIKQYIALKLWTSVRGTELNNYKIVFEEY